MNVPKSLPDVSVLVVGWSPESLADTTEKAVRKFGAVDQALQLQPNPNQGTAAFFSRLMTLLTAHAKKALEHGSFPVVVLSEWVPPNTLVLGSRPTQVAPALAILCLPEVFFLFGAVNYSKSLFWNDYHCIDKASVFASPLYDFTGLRHWIRQTYRFCQGAEEISQPDTVLVVEDEPHYRNFIQYAIYRSDLPSLGPASFTDMEAILASDGNACKFAHQVHDVFVEYPDQEERDDITGQKARFARFPALAVGLKTLTVVSSQGEDSGWHPAEGGLDRFAFAAVSKPLRGLIEFWQSCAASKRSDNRCLVHWRISQYAFYDEIADSRPMTNRHGTPGIWTSVILTLLCRAEQLLRKNGDLLSIVQAATMCSDAARLFRKQAPTTAIEARSIQEHAETLLECQFFGVAADPNFDDRLMQLSQDLTLISLSYTESRRRHAAVTAELEILSRIIPILRGSGRFEEEIICLTRARWLRLYVRLFSRSHLARLSALISAYPVFLLNSLASFSVGFAFNLAIFGWLYYLSDPSKSGTENLLRASITTLATQPLEPSNVLACDYFCIASSLFHFGIFISLLFSTLMRR